MPGCLQRATGISLYRKLQRSVYFPVTARGIATEKPEYQVSSEKLSTERGQPPVRRDPRADPASDTGHSQSPRQVSRCIG